ncbi:anaerobic benzoate catabolism transcriptional regulator [Rubripirellula lacrimiformis]|uniref:Anaerobic benzoate catabolism transcriptional regulator n=1 Tax=Rubripirellula lacrimiformis TaxID=1930273 RepID=A0A517NJX5_9BACT|nr:helix-turn-helix transcriptional regulator [Rubripirellula lacrimiformis]QDT07437.1 anaerobic benzoate catabolism transcriptional regulator [Rubripirellula lacrimiformis]
MTTQQITTVADENRREPTDKTRRIARRLASMRKSQGISQNELCEKLGLTQSMMSRYENGERRIPSELLADFAAAIGVSADELLGLEAVKKNAQEMDEETKKLWKKFQQFSKLPEHDRRAVTRLINSLSRTKKAS